MVAVGHYDFGQIDGTQREVEGVGMFARPVAGQFQVAAVDDFCAAGSEQVAEFFQGGTPLVAAAWSQAAESGGVGVRVFALACPWAALSAVFGVIGIEIPFGPFRPPEAC